MEESAQIISNFGVKDLQGNKTPFFLLDGKNGVLIFKKDLVLSDQ